MPSYVKCCPICFTDFPTSRMSSIYCTTKCRNKARSLPDRVLQSLFAKVGGTTRVIDSVPRAVQEYMRKHQLDRDNTPIAVATGVNKTDLDILEEQGRKILREIEIKKQEIDLKDVVLPHERNKAQIELEDDPMAFADPEMKDFKFGESEQIPEENNNDNPNDNGTIRDNEEKNVEGNGRIDNC